MWKYDENEGIIVNEKIIVKSLSHTWYYKGNKGIGNIQRIIEDGFYIFGARQNLKKMSNQRR